MSSENTKALTLREKAAQIDVVASEAMKLFDGAGSFANELAVAQAISDLRAALTPEIMQPIMSLMNTDLGFLTDQDPRKPSKNNPTPQPYPVATVRDCVIEAKLRGFHTIGNEFNIISGRFYAARNGLKRRCETWPGVTDLKIVIGLPRQTRDGEASCAIYAEWKKNGVKDEIMAPGGKPLEVLIRVNAFMGPDAIVGKAERKLYKRIYDRLSGKVTQDGEVDDIVAPLEKERVPIGPGPAAQPQDDTKAEAAAGLAPVEKSEPKPEPKPEQKAKFGLVEKRQQLAEIVAAAGASYDDFARFARGQHGDGDKDIGLLAWDTYSGYDDLPEKLCDWAIKAKRGLINALRGMKEVR